MGLKRVLYEKKYGEYRLVMSLMLANEDLESWYTEF